MNFRVKPLAPMWTSVFVVLALMFTNLLATSVAADEAQSLVGKWTGKDSDGDSVTMVFNQDKSAEVYFEGIPALTSANLVDGKVEWSANRGFGPATLDVIIHTGENENGRLRMIFRFSDDGALDIRNSRDMKTRPVTFDITSTVYQILLTRQ